MSAMTRNVNRMKHQITSMKNAAASSKVLARTEAQKNGGHGCLQAEAAGPVLIIDAHIQLKIRLA